MKGFESTQLRFIPVRVFLQAKKILACCFVLLLGEWAEGATRVWIDTDIAIGSPIREVDDAFALFLAVRSPELQIAGISTSYGNAPLEATTAAATDFVSRLKKDVRIYPGARSRHDLGRETIATRGLAEALRKSPGLTYVALGPATNLATFQRLHPKLSSRIRRVIFLGGTPEGADLLFGSARRIRVHDANVLKDAPALSEILKSQWPITLVPVATAAKMTINKANLENIGRGGKAGQFLQDKSKVWLWFWTGFLQENGAPVFDCAAILAAAKPAALRFERRFVALRDPGNLIVVNSFRPGSRAVECATGITPVANRLVVTRLRE